MREHSLGKSVIRVAVLLAALGSAPAYLVASSDLTSPRPVLNIPRVTRAPVIEDFLEMKPNGEMERQLAKVEDFIQWQPANGKPSSQRTEVYFGYDSQNLYSIFLCFDLEPQKIRARMTQRENIFGDDLVSLTLDTFHDQRRAYEFWANPFGIQMDEQYIEGQPLDTSFDMLWYSRGQLTEQGYVVLMAIPFESLRFPSTPEQIWGITFWRGIPRVNEFFYMAPYFNSHRRHTESGRHPTWPLEPLSRTERSVDPLRFPTVLSRPGYPRPCPASVCE